MKNIIDYFKKKKDKTANLFELINFFGKGVEKFLKELQNKGEIVEIRKNFFIYLKNTPFLLGKVYLQGKGILVETKEGYYFFNLNPLKLMAGDLVLLKKEKRGLRIFKILERAYKKLVGFYLGEKLFLPIMKKSEEFVLKDEVKLPKGTIIETEILVYPNKNKKGLVKLKNVLGSYGDEDAEIIGFCKSRNLSIDFPEEVLKEAGGIKEKFSLRERDDFTKEEIFTIDPKNAKDFDDAISLKEEGDFFVLGVHIADVSHYVKENTSMDNEAVKRGETLYFPSRAIHMLPPKLSENICSLKEGKKKFCVSLLIYFDKKWKHLKTEIRESIIKSKKRFIYEEVEEILKGRKSPFSKTLKKMEELSEFLKEKRIRRGSLEFEFPEFELIYGEDGKIREVAPLYRLKSHSIVEEFMLFANREVARYLYNKNYNFLYRIHEKPDPFKLMDLKVLVQRWGFDFPVNVDEPTPKMLQRILKEWKNLEEGVYFQELLLRSLPRAIYSPIRDIHFALNFNLYCHFTSPIRRYADLLNHRVLKKAMRNEKIEISNLKELAEGLNEKSRVKEEIERDFLEYKILQILKEREGEVFIGTIVSVLDSGFFVFIPRYFVTGFLPFSSFKNNFIIAYKGEQRAGDLKGRYSFKLRDEIKVKIKEVEPLKRRLTLDYYPYD